MKKELVLKKKGFSTLERYLEFLSIETKFPLDFVKQLASTFELNSLKEFKQLEAALNVF